MAALVEAIYRADTTIGRTRKKSNFGTGTFNDLDGALVLLDGKIYCLRPHGDAEVIGDDVRTPFVLVKQFEGDTEERFDDPVAETDFEHALLDLIPSTNLMYALIIEGKFSHLRARAVLKQSNYLSLAEIAQLQTVFEFQDVYGVIIGFYTPDFLSGVHMTGLHLHFITADRKHGGRLPGATADGVTVSLQHAPSIDLELPLTLDFLPMKRMRAMKPDLDKVER